MLTHKLFMRRSKKFSQRSDVVVFLFVVLADKGREYPNTSLLLEAFRWQADNGQTLTAGLVQ